MLRLLKILTLNLVGAQYLLPGSQRDDHNCVIDGGYEWCESAQACQRPWELPCETTCLKECPLPPPCPMPPMTPNCRYLPALPDSCGCIIGCGTVDCSSQQKLPVGGTCGGFMPYGMAGICDDGLECVNTMGPYIADAPGTCQPMCSNSRDQWGNCIDEGCNHWFDGCNTCSIQSDGNQLCTEIACYQLRGNPECRDNQTIIPLNCVTWFDGCNTCSVDNGILQGCTLMMCFVNNGPYCQVFTSGELVAGEICYRFCEDGSQNAINRQKDCPDGTECSSLSNIISFDSCGDKSHTCNIISGH